MGRKLSDIPSYEMHFICVQYTDFTHIIIQSFQVEGPKNREISLFIENTIRRFFTGFFQGGKTASNVSCYLSCDYNTTSVTQIVTI